MKRKMQKQQIGNRPTENVCGFQVHQNKSTNNVISSHMEEFDHIKKRKYIFENVTKMRNSVTLNGKLYCAIIIKIIEIT